MQVRKDLIQIVGQPYVLDEANMEKYLLDWRGRISGRAIAVVLPGNKQELIQVVNYCQEKNIPITTQGGNTGLCGGSIPDQSGQSIVIVTQRMNRIVDIDVINETITVEAGCTLKDVQDAAKTVSKLFPLSLASEGSCTIGGNIATNAGGTQVLRYGTMRDLVLGLEAVMPDGSLYEGLKGLRKDNTGYSLNNLLIGSEGTLGIVTAATLKLFPMPKSQRTAMVCVSTPAKALELLHLAKARLASGLTAFELIAQTCLHAVTTLFPEQKNPFVDESSRQSEWFVLLEHSDFEGDEHAYEQLSRLLSQAMEEDIISDAVISQSIQQSRRLWHLRESIPLAEKALGKAVKNDISLPISGIDDFIQTTNALLQEAFPGCKHIIFGHLGDGNLHYNVGPSSKADPQFVEKYQDQIFKIVWDNVAKYNGSISAEHGIGSLKKDYLPRYKSAVELNLMKKIKQAWDPKGLMNPGKLLSN
ncbi:FAD-binding oxidoreductase [Basilea psittacipulmonis]|uniref:2-hydroxyacid dehydrogenase n=1 Tax=Basilea psittacipulmonis DSM 24701 TaxID=1072685 RepID=A0A077DCY3_9BURK|nr:FAD-binding oxidoreductase [Basilea psittacipulmonis]AIL32469.1 2-hydroxyacid dehydrogenase [Basilea psittacipulmonis DSM 24701]